MAKLLSVDKLLQYGVGAAVIGSAIVMHLGTFGVFIWGM